MLLAREEFDNDISKVTSRVLLDTHSQARLISLFDSREEREEARETLQGQTQKEREKYLSEISKAKEEKKQLEAQIQGWRSDSIKYMEAARSGDSKIKELEAKLAEKAKVIYQSNDEEAIRQIKEAADNAINTERARRLKLEKSYHDDVKRGVDRAKEKIAKEIGEKEQYLREVTLMAERAAKEFDEITARKARSVDVACLIADLKQHHHAVSITLADLFHDDEGILPEEAQSALNWINKSIDGLLQAKDFAEKLIKSSRADLKIVQ